MTRSALLPAGRFAYRPRRRAARAIGGESGQALLILIVMLSIATMLLVYGSTTEVERAIKADNRARLALEQARQALIGRAIADASRPGSLPCPDTGDDGSADLFNGSACPSYIGRLPWRTLGVGDLRDQHGERLWYALSPAFRDHPGAPPLNTDTRGSLTVFSNSAATVIASDAIAVVFAPGFAMKGQVRDDTVELCAATGKAVSRKRCASNYLDAAAGVNNAKADGPFVAGSTADGYNDRLAVIVAADLMPLVERRVAIELRNALIAYRAQGACACYPWADAAGSGDSAAGASRGRVPVRNVLPHAWPAGALPQYFVTNDWARAVYYAAAREALEARGAACTTCAADTLALDGADGYDVMLISTGYATAARKGAAPLAYIEDAENANEDDRYVTPRATGADRDRVWPILGQASSCAAHARVLLDNAPCAAAPSGVTAACLSASAALARCSCAPAAGAMVRAPCAAAPNTAACETAMALLRGCTS
ncbi:MAG TPA: hypothetical protein VHP37_05155 [Burkholderiales bacterium]|nr:hypothetical protein [Burkholderiales bacterium]